MDNFDKNKNYSHIFNVNVILNLESFYNFIKENIKGYFDFDAFCEEADKKSRNVLPTGGTSQ